MNAPRDVKMAIYLTIDEQFLHVGRENIRLKGAIRHSASYAMRFFIDDVNHEQMTACWGWSGCEEVAEKF